MKTLKIIVSLSIAFVALAARAELQPCGTVETDTKLQSDCEGPMVVAASNIVVDLNGYAVRCSTATAPGITIDDQTNVMIKDGTVTHCLGGIYVNGGGGHLLRRLSVIENQGNFGGIGINASSGNTISKTVIRLNDPAAIFASGSDGTHIFGCVVSSNRGGVAIEGSLDNDISGNSIYANVSGGISMVGGQNNRIAGNTIWGNGIGIHFDLVEFSTILSNTVDNNAAGIALEFGATNNTIANNEAFGNAIADLIDDNPNCDDNIWRHNDFGTSRSFPSCIQ